MNQNGDAIVPPLGPRAYVGLALAAVALALGQWAIGLLAADALGVTTRVGALALAPALVAGAALARRGGVGRALVAAAAGIMAGFAVVADAAPLTGVGYGVTWRGPVPMVAVDLSVDAGGVARLRAKSHRVAWAELAPLAAGSDVVVVAAGWSRGAVVDRDAAEALGSRLVVLATPDAVARYAALRRAGRRVALLLHATC